MPLSTLSVGRLYLLDKTRVATDGSFTFSRQKTCNVQHSLFFMTLVYIKCCTQHVIVCTCLHGRSSIVSSFNAQNP